jgi:hypothetical protein
VACNFTTKVASMLVPGASDAVLTMQLLMMQVRAIAVPTWYQLMTSACL